MNMKNVLGTVEQLCPPSCQESQKLTKLTFNGAAEMRQENLPVRSGRKLKHMRAVWCFIYSVRSEVLIQHHAFGLSKPRRVPST